MSEQLPTILLKIDVTKIEKARLFKGEKGTYLDCVLVPKREVGQYGDVYMVVQSVTKEERESGNRGPIIGNGKFMPRKQDAPKTSSPAAMANQPESDDVPFN